MLSSKIVLEILFKVRDWRSLRRRGRPSKRELPDATSCSCVLFFVPSCVSKLPLKYLKVKDWRSLRRRGRPDFFEKNKKYISVI